MVIGELYNGKTSKMKWEEQEMGEQEMGNVGYMNGGG